MIDRENVEKFAQEHHIRVTSALRPRAAKRAKIPVWVALLTISLNKANSADSPVLLSRSQF